MPSGIVTKLGIEYRKVNGVLVKFYPQTAAEQVLFDSDSYENVSTVKAALEDLDTRIAQMLPLDALVFKGIVDGTNNILPYWNSYSSSWERNEPAIGDVYRVTVAGTYGGEECEPGDMLTCIGVNIIDHTASWAATQTNIDGAVVGPDYSVDAHIAVYDGTTGKAIKDGGMSIQGLKNYADAAVTTHDVQATELASGHVTLSDATNDSSGAYDGVAATPLAVKTVADALVTLGGVSWSMYGTDAESADVTALGEGGSYLEFSEDFWTEDEEPEQEGPPDNG